MDNRFFTFVRDGEWGRIPRDWDTNAVQDNVQTVQNIPKHCPDHMQGLSRRTLERVQRRPWTERTVVEANRRTPSYKIGAIACGAVVVISIISTLADCPGNIQIGLYLAALAIEVWYDFILLFRNLLATPCQKLLSVLLGTFSLCYFTLQINLLKIATGEAVIVLIVIFSLNSRWLAEFNFCMNPVIHKTLNNNHDSAAFRAWIHYGERDCKTFARYNRNDMSDKIVNGLYRGYWTLGYNAAAKYVVSLKKQLLQAQEATDDALRLVDQAVDTAERTQLDNDDLIIKIHRLQSDIQDLQEKLNNIPDPDPEPVVIDQAEAEAQAVELLKSGMSVRQVAHQVGLNKTRVGQIRKDLHLDAA